MISPHQIRGTDFGESIWGAREAHARARPRAAGFNVHRGMAGGTRRARNLGQFHTGRIVSKKLTRHFQKEKWHYEVIDSITWTLIDEAEPAG